MPKIGDMAFNPPYEEHFWIITGLNQHDPSLPPWCNDSVRLEYLFTRPTNWYGSEPIKKIRYVAKRIFDREWEIVSEM